MAKLTEIVVAIEAEGVANVLAALKQVDGAQARVADSSKKHGDAQKTANESAGMSWDKLATGVNQAIGVITKAVNAGKAVYNFAKEGAQLEYAAGKFDRLAESAGTTSDVLLGDLKAATRGMVSDAELMASAGDFMALGLAKSHDEVVRLTNVAGALGMNMNQLVLTLTNQTTMRFDALGVSVDGFKEKVAALEAAGYSAQDAFTEAFLQQAEEQISKVGNVADTTAGKIMAMEAAWKNLKNAVQENIANSEGLQGLVSHFTLDLQVSTANTKWDALRDKVEEEIGLSTSQMSKFSGFTKMFYGSSAEQDQLYLEDAAVSMENFGGLLEWHTRLQKEYGLTAEETGVKLGQMIDTFGTGILTGSMTDSWAEGIEGVGQEAETTADKISEAFATSMIGASNIGLNYDAMATDWTTMRKMAEGYDSALTLINANTARQKRLEPFKETGGYLDGVWMSAEQVNAELADIETSSADAETAMAQMAANMTLSFMQTSMGIDGYTESEIDALTQYMVDAGLLSQAAADKMKADYMAAITYANALELDAKIGEILANIEDYEDGMKIVDGKLVNAKTGEVLADISDYLDGLTEADLAELDPKVAEVLADILPYIADLLGLPDPDPKTVDITANYIDKEFVPTKYPRAITIDVNYNDPGVGHYQTAIGGPVYPGQFRTWNEPGREGELLIPEQYGRVLSNHEVAQVMREALMGGGAESRNNGGQTQMINNYNYVLNMPTSNSPSDVAMAYELMQALGG